MRDYTNYRVNQKDVDELSKDLRKILDLELSNGNRISETWRGWPLGGIVVKLASPFKTENKDRPCNITFKETKDTRFWKAEYIDSTTKDMLLCDY